MRVTISKTVHLIYCERAKFREEKMNRLTSLSLLLGVFSIINLGTCCVSHTQLFGERNRVNPNRDLSTFKTCDKTPEIYNLRYLHEEKIENLPQFRKNNCSEILQSSSFPLQTFFNKNGFVETVVESYNEHHNLIIRPDDVWAAIMTQFSLYINKNAEEFRGKFVDFEGQRTLTVKAAGSLRSVSYGSLVKQMSDEIDKNLVDPEVKKWILPKFSTTTDNDKVAVGAIFMASMKKYFKYQFSLACGIPFVTLKGTVQDWQDILKRLEKLKDYKLEKWYSMLKPILTQFVEAKKGQVDSKFWQRICHYEAGGSGPSYISGWITAFCVFDEDGNWRYGADKASAATNWFKLDTDEIPTGIVEVDVKIDDNGVEHKSVMFAGHVGTEVKADNKTLQPVLGWAIALKRS